MVGRLRQSEPSQAWGNASPMGLRRAAQLGEHWPPVPSVFVFRQVAECLTLVCRA